MKAKVIRAFLAGMLFTGLAASLMGCQKKEVNISVVPMTEETEKMEVTEDTEVATEENGPVISDDCPIDATCEEYMRTIRSFSVEKIVTEIVDLGEQGSDYYYLSYLVSDIDLDKKEVRCKDYTESFASIKTDLSKIKECDFKEAFGVDPLEQKNMLGMMEALLQEEGFDGNFRDCTYGVSVDSYLVEEVYKFNQPSSVEEWLLEDTAYDKLISSRCTYNVEENAKNLLIPHAFTAVVQYEKAGIFHTRTCTLSFYYQEEKAEDEIMEEGTETMIEPTMYCPCGHEDMSDCDMECMDSCEEQLQKDQKDNSKPAQSSVGQEQKQSNTGFGKSR